MGTLIVLIGLIGLATGVPIGVLSNQHFSKKRCHIAHCSGIHSKVCVDHLCVEHCKRYHHEKCTQHFH